MLRFLALFFGPVFAKEMVEMARRKRYYLNRVFYGLVLLFTLWAVWKDRQHTIQNGMATLRVMAELAEMMFHAVSGVQYGAVFLFVPLFLCGVIASEREERTLDLLFTTQLRDREIVLGKLASRTVAVVALILCALPVLSIIMLFGGIDPEGLWRVQGSTLLAILFAGAHAIYFSALTKSPMGALVRTYWWMGVYLLAVPGITVLILSGMTAGPSARVSVTCLTILFMINPIGPFFVSLNGYLYNFMATNPYVGDWFFPLSFVFPTGFSLLLLWRAVVRLRLPPSAFAVLLRRLAPVRAARSGLRPVGAAFTAPLRYLQFPARWIRNPFWLRARRARVYDREGYIGRVQWLAWFAALLFLVLTLAFHAHELGRAGTSIPFLVIGWIVVLIMTVILAGSSLVGDRRRGFLDLVLMSPLTPREMIDGTLLTVWQHMRRLFWLIVVLSAFFGISGASTWAGLSASLFTATLFCALVALYGTVFSLLSRTVPGALVPTFLFPMLMLVGILFFMALFREEAGPAIWIFSAICLAVTWPWALRRPGVASVAAYFMAIHLVLTSAATCWTRQSNHHREYPIAVMNPGFIAFPPLEGRHGEWYYGINEPKAYMTQGGPTPAPQPLRVYLPGTIDKETVLLLCYWSALLVNFVWVRWWAIRNFERLVERTDVPARRSLLARLLRKRSAPGVEAVVAEPVTQR